MRLHLVESGGGFTNYLANLFLEHVEMVVTLNLSQFISDYLTVPCMTVYN